MTVPIKGSVGGAGAAGSASGACAARCGAACDTRGARRLVRGERLGAARTRQVRGTRGCVGCGAVHAGGSSAAARAAHCRRPPHAALSTPARPPHAPPAHRHYTHCRRVTAADALLRSYPTLLLVTVRVISHIF